MRSIEMGNTEYMGRLQSTVHNAKLCINCDDDPEMQVPSPMAAALSDGG
jgi:hypothetical protein